MKALSVGMLLMSACAIVVPQNQSEELSPDTTPIIPPELADAGLKIYAVPQSNTNSVLGAAVDPQSGQPILTRQMLLPTARTTDYGSWHYEGLRRFSTSSGVIIQTDLFNADVSFGQTTHISYEVQVNRTSYLSDRQYYDPHSRCCNTDGSVAVECSGGVVSRVLSGWGTINYLQALSTHAGLGVGPIEVHNGTSYLVQNSRSFSSSIFAIEVESAQAVCQRAACEQRNGDFCTRCELIAAQADVGEITPPANGLMRLVCRGMHPGTPVVVGLHGKINSPTSCRVSIDTNLNIAVDGHLPMAFTVPRTIRTSAPTTLSYESPMVRADETGTVVATLGMDLCSCAGDSATCQLYSDFLLSITELP